MPANSEPQWETIARAAARKLVSTQTIRRRIADGTLTAYRLGPTLIRLDAAQVDAMLRPIPTVTRLAS